MPIQFFNFWNHETFHFFKWICESVPAGPDALIADAYQKAEQLDDTIEFPDEDVCFIVRSRLTDKLREILYNTAPDLEDTDLLEIGNISLDSEGRPSARSLLDPILAHALANIDCQVVAEALLMQAGKWNPSKEPPEVV